MGSGEKGILLLPDLLRKGYIFKALGQAWLREESFIDFVWRNVPGTFGGGRGRGFCCFTFLIRWKL